MFMLTFKMPKGKKPVKVYSTSKKVKFKTFTKKS